MGRKSSHGTKELVNLPTRHVHVVLKDRHEGGWLCLLLGRDRFARAGNDTSSPGYDVGIIHV